MKTRLTSGPRAFLDEAIDLVAQRIDLDDEVEVELFHLTHLDQPIHDRLPILVAGKIVIGDEEAVDALRQVGPDDFFDVIGRTASRFAALYIDDGVEAALVGTAPARVKTGQIIGGPADMAGRHERD